MLRIYKDCFRRANRNFLQNRKSNIQRYTVSLKKSLIYKTRNFKKIIWPPQNSIWGCGITWIRLRVIKKKMVWDKRAIKCYTEGKWMRKRRISKKLKYQNRNKSALDMVKLRTHFEAIYIYIYISNTKNKFGKVF